jgi:hypothetical protein
MTASSGSIPDSAHGIYQVLLLVDCRSANLGTTITRALDVMDQIGRSRVGRLVAHDAEALHPGGYPAYAANVWVSKLLNVLT